MSITIPKTSILIMLFFCNYLLDNNSRVNKNLIESIEEFELLLKKQNGERILADSIIWKTNSFQLLDSEKHKIDSILNRLEINNSDTIEISYYDFDIIEYSESLSGRRILEIKKYLEASYDINFQFDLFYLRMSQHNLPSRFFVEKGRKIIFSIKH
jgi:hypothetical protein